MHQLMESYFEFDAIFRDGGHDVILCLECFHCYVIIIDCLLTSFDILYFSADGCINRSLTYLLTSFHAQKCWPWRANTKCLCARTFATKFRQFLIYSTLFIVVEQSNAETIRCKTQLQWDTTKHHTQRMMQHQIQNTFLQTPQKLGAKSWKAARWMEAD